MSTPRLDSDIKNAFLLWFNTFGMSYSGSEVEILSDLWREHIPSLLHCLTSPNKEGNNEAVRVKGISPEDVFHKTYQFMEASDDLCTMAKDLKPEEAANGDDLEIMKFLLLFWHEMCMSEQKVAVKKSIEYMEQCGLHEPMMRAIAWMDKTCLTNQDFNNWYLVLFENGLENSFVHEAIQAGDAVTPVRSEEDFDRGGFVSPAIPLMRASLHEGALASYQSSFATPCRYSSRRQLPIPCSEPRYGYSNMPPPTNSPIADRVNSPAYREKRREREIRSLQEKLSKALEENDVKEMNITELRNKLNMSRSGYDKLKDRLDNTSSELITEKDLTKKLDSKVKELMDDKKNIEERFENGQEQIKRLKDENEALIDENTMNCKTVNELNSKIDILKREKVDVVDELSWKNHANRDLTNRVSKLEETIREITEEYESIRLHCEEMKKEYERKMIEKEEEYIVLDGIKNNHLSEMSRKLNEREETIKKLEGDIEKKKKEMEREVNEREETIKKLEDDIEKKSKELNDMKEEMEIDIEKKKKEMKDMIDKMKKDRESYENDRRKKDMEMKNMNEEIDKLNRTVYNLESENFSLNNSSTDAVSQLQQVICERDRLKLSIDDMRKRMEGVEGMKKERDDAVIQLGSIKGDMELLKDENTNLKEENSSTREVQCNTMMENNRLNDLIEKMKSEESKRIEEEERKLAQLKEDNVNIELELNKVIEEKNTLAENNYKIEEELKNLKFIAKNEKRKLLELPKLQSANKVLIEEKIELKEKIDSLERNLNEIKETVSVNMENVILKKKEFENKWMIAMKENAELKAQMENMKKEKEEEDREKEMKEAQKKKVKEEERLNVLDTTISSVYTVNNGRTNLHHITNNTSLLDFDEEPTQLEYKTIRGVKIDGLVEAKVVDKKVGFVDDEDDKENGGWMPQSDTLSRRQLPKPDMKKRYDELAKRNAATLPHNRCAYAAELGNASPSSQSNYSLEGIRKGELLKSGKKSLSNIRLFKKK